jgi:hypothetical protein
MEQTSLSKQNACCIPFIRASQMLQEAVKSIIIILCHRVLLILTEVFN